MQNGKTRLTTVELRQKNTTEQIDRERTMISIKELGWERDISDKEMNYEYSRYDRSGIQERV